jgi:hypothetical protein
MSTIIIKLPLSDLDLHTHIIEECDLRLDAGWRLQAMATVIDTLVLVFQEVKAVTPTPPTFPIS